MAGWLETIAQTVALGLRAGDIQSKADLQQVKHREAKRLHAPRMPQDPELLALLEPAEQARFAHLLRKKPMRSQSGVAVVAVMSSPAACPHGKCIYCPGGPDAGAPQSYTGFEPSTMRAKRLDYDAYRIVRTRLQQLQRNGHPIDKVEVVIQGGTFPARDKEYQSTFVAAIYQACNDGPGDGQAPATDLAHAMQENEGAVCRVVGLTVETKPDWCLEPHIDAMLSQGATRIELGIQTLDEAVTRLTHRGHTVADARRAMQVARDAGYKVCVHMMPGLPRPAGDRGTRPSGVLEEDPRVPGLARPAGERGTRPSGVLEEDPRVPGLARPQVEVGTATAAGRHATPLEDPQSLDIGHVPENQEAGPQAPSRPSSSAASPAASLPTLPIAARDAHFTIDPAADIEDIRQLFADPDFRPDMLKIYPTLIVQEGETTLKRWWQEGRFLPMDTPVAIDVVAEALRHVPEYCRIQRIDRDIPTTHVLAGVMHSNLRQLAEAEAKRRGIRLRDIRAREIGTRQREGMVVDPDRLVLVRRDYEASGGGEAFISLEDPSADALAGFVRVRRVARPHRAELEGAAVIRELKVYGAAQRLGAHDAGSWQHQGLGARLLSAAEETAWDWGVQRVAVLAGPGVKEYYRNRGYADLGPYLSKERP